MSDQDQPPYPGNPQGQPPQPPYGQGPPPSYGQVPPHGYGPPPKKSHTARNVLIVLGVLMVLFCGGCLAVAWSFFNEVDKAIEEEEENDRPAEVTEGMGFEHDEYDVDDGWSVAKDRFGDVTIKGLRVTNSADEGRSALLTFRFYKGKENLAEVECSSRKLQQGESSQMDCYTFDDGFPAGYDAIKVSDRW